MTAKQKCLEQQKKCRQQFRKEIIQNKNMKRFYWIANIFLLALILASCSDVRRRTGAVYMPDMAYSRAIETYAPLDSAKFTSDTNARGEGKIFYNARPVTGSMAIGDEVPFPIVKDKTGDT